MDCAAGSIEVALQLKLLTDLNKFASAPARGACDPAPEDGRGTGSPKTSLLNDHARIVPSSWVKGLEM
jgi:hypothetical protein